MPCGDSRVWSRRFGDNFREEEVMLARLDRATRILCRVIRTIEGTESLTLLSKALGKDGVAWWARHQEEDAFRRSREAEVTEHRERRSEALSKLTEADRSILGLP